MLEVEVKLRLEDPPALREQLEAFGAPFVGHEHHRDSYFRHPMRDFIASDEALRLRRIGDTFELTYKGPRQDTAAKVRLEHNVGLADDPSQLLQSLGFTTEDGVEKHREVWQLDGATVCIDDLGRLGWFAEVEVLSDDVEGATALVEATMEKLGLLKAERISKSYMALWNQ